MDISRLRSISRISILLCSIIGIYACDSGGGSNRAPTSVAASPTPIPSDVPGPSGPKVTPIPTLQLGAPTTKPIAIPPSSNKTNVQFISVVSGTYQPDELILDEVDENGTVVTLDVARLHDGGVDGDAFRGDRTYSGNVPVSSRSSVERLFRVRAVDDGISDDANIESGTGRFWISGCPVVARPSNPAKAMLDSRLNSFIFTDEVLVTFADDVAPDLDELNNILSAVGGRVVGCIPALRQYLVEITENSTVDDVYVDIDTLLAIDTVDDATPNIQVLALIESEPDLCDEQECQWYLDRIRAPQAWSIAGGGDEQRAVAVIDFGVDCTHAELPCDGNIFNEDLIDHGTGVAGLIGAKNDDGTDLVGVAWNTDLFPYSFLGEGGSQYKMSELITQSMSESSIRVINISAATALDPGGQIRNAMCSAIDSGRLLVVAAGNAAKANDCELENIYPAQYNTQGVCSNGVDLASGLIVVGATDIDNNLAEWEGGLLCSNTLHVDIFAPGKGIYTSSGTDSYTSKDGTSFASPLVAGSAAVLWAAEPSLTVKELHDQLVSSSAILSLNASDDRFKTTDTFLEGRNLLDLYRAVGGQETAPAVTVVTPDAFAFNTESDVALDEFITSNEVIITGFSSTAPIDIVGGFYSINGAPFTSAAGLVGAGQSVVLQVRSSTQPEELRRATLTLGDAIESFEVVTELPDIQADNFNFIDRKNAGLGSEVDSNILAIQGISDGTTVTIEGGLYSIDGFDFTGLPGILNANQEIQIRVITSNTAETIHTATITIGGVTDSYTVETEIIDSDPTPYSFAPKDDVDPNTIQFADIVTVIDDNSLDTVEGLNVDTAISISGGLYSIDGGPLRDDASTVSAGQTVRVLHTSANTFGSNAFTTLTIGSYSATFRSTTVASPAPVENLAPVASNVNIEGGDGSEVYVGDTLTSTYEYSDLEGDAQGEAIYQWLRNGRSIVGATNSAYTLIADDSGETIALNISAVANEGEAIGNAVLSTNNVVVSNSAPTISNVQIVDDNGSTVMVGDTLSVTFNYNDLDSDPEGAHGYVWFRDGSDIGGATNSTYILTVADVNRTITVSVTPNANGGDATGSAGGSAGIDIPNAAPTATAVVINGSTNIGSTLEGGYLYEDIEDDVESGSTYRWLRGDIEVATTQNYTLAIEDAGQALVFEVRPRAANGTAIGVAVASEPTSVPQAYEVSYIAGAGGSLLGNAAQVILHGNNATTITAQPDEGYVFTLWSDGVTTASRAEINVIATINVNASFTISTYSVTATAGDGGSVNTVSQSVNHGQAVSITITPDAGYRIDTVTGCSGSIEGNLFTTNAITGACDLLATFVLDVAIPNQFTFMTINDAVPNELRGSNTVVLSGSNGTASISVSGGEYQVNSGSYISEPGTIAIGDSLTVRLTSPIGYDMTSRMTINVGGVTADFLVATINRPDYDLDEDGLIEINRLEDLNEMRNYLDGSALYGMSNGCPIDGGCIGFELAADLDFDSNADGVMDANDAYWNDGLGWLPVRGFSGVFEGNGHIITNLYVDRPMEADVGLFGNVRDATIRNLGLSGALASVRGNRNVASVAGQAFGSDIHAVYSTVTVGSESLLFSYTGGIVGNLVNSNLRVSFYGGAVESNGRNVGGLVAYMGLGSSIEASYSIAPVTSYIPRDFELRFDPRNVGGLVGTADSVEVLVTASYWAIDRSGVNISFGGTAVPTLAELQCPISADDIACSNRTLFEGWSNYLDDDGLPYWNFGTNTELPALIWDGLALRDGDGDGVIDSRDAFPTNYAASRDTDADGHPDSWTLACDIMCIAGSGLTYDYFPTSVEASLDADLDGRPDSWNEGCDEVCQSVSGLSLDLEPADYDNDGIVDIADNDDNNDRQTDADADSDGLLDISSLDQLNAMRYELAGLSFKTSIDSVGDSSGCPVRLHKGRMTRNCLGYALQNDLDFDSNSDGFIDGNDSYWNAGEGWLPVGTAVIGDEFSATFDGQGHLIRNLFIDRPEDSNIGLFGGIRGAEIVELGLTGSLARVNARGVVGAFAGSSYRSQIRASFSTVVVRANDVFGHDVGGFIGSSMRSDISVSYATGSVSGSRSLGGLVGDFILGGSIEGSFSAGVVDNSGGLIGSGDVNLITDSYGAGHVDLDFERSLEILQCPIAASSSCGDGLYYRRWEEYQDDSGNRYWDFGDASQLPGLIIKGRTYRDGDGDGSIDEEDAFPALFAASLDVDTDGYPDRISLGCDTSCFDASGLEYDQFPGNSAVAIDDDMDGFPDVWNPSCDGNCQSDSGFTLDNSLADTDNDGRPNSSDTDDDGNNEDDADIDSDGLLEITSLEQLNAMRFSLLGIGMQLSEGATIDSSGCPRRVVEQAMIFACHGYELTSDIDFDSNDDGLMNADDAYWNDAAGWEPIGDSGNRFVTTFEGNGFGIFNLYIDRPGSEHQGLFGYTEGATVRGLVLTGSLSQVRGLRSVGAIAGRAYVNTTIEGVISTVPIITETSSLGYAGGLVGYLDGSTIRASFTSGSVSSQGYYVGGLVGSVVNLSSIEASLSTGYVSGSSSVGGLLGNYSRSGVVIANYWATDTSVQDSSAGGAGATGATLAELQCPTTPDDSVCASVTLFEGWDTYQDAEGNPYWDFGTATELPGLDLGGFTHRDSDGNGILDIDEVTPQ